MRILFATYPLAFQNPGGGEKALLALARELRALGHQVDHFDPWQHDPGNYELIHYFSSLEYAHWAWFKKVAPRVPLIVTPTLWQEGGVQLLWSRFKNEVNDLLAAPSRMACFRLVDLWLPVVEEEGRRLGVAYGIPRKQIELLPNGVDRRFLDATPEVFQQRFKISEPFILHVGRFHPVKNHLRLIEVVRKLQSTCVFIGAPASDDPSYHLQCRESARLAMASDSSGRTRLHFLDELPQEAPELASAYAACAVFTLPSHFETFGMAALEAAAAGAPIVLTKKAWSRKLFEESSGGLVSFVDPDSVDEIEKALKKQLATPARLSSEARASLFQKFGWEPIARKLESLYRKSISR